MTDLAGVLLAARGFDRVAGAGAVDEDAFLTDGFTDLGEASVDVLFLFTSKSDNKRTDCISH